MKSARFLWKPFLLHAAVLALVLGFCVWAVVTRYETFYLKEVTSRLRKQATTLATALPGRFDIAHREDLKALARKLGEDEGVDVRVTFVCADGRVLGDSAVDPVNLESHADRPEIREALARGWGETVRWSHTVAGRLCYAAVRVGSADAPQGVVRVAMPLYHVRSEIGRHREAALIVTTLGLLGGLSLLFGVAWLRGRRIERITAFAGSLSRGDLSSPVGATGEGELAGLSQALRRTRDRLARGSQALERQQRTLPMLLDQLGEGIVITAPDGRVALVNAAARRLLQLSTDPSDRSWVGLPLEECIAQHELQAMMQPGAAKRAPGEVMGDDASKTLPPASLSPLAAEMRVELMTPEGPVSVRARAADIAFSPFSTTGQANEQVPIAGRLLVLTDVSELTHAVQMKADFAANASHELRTPLAAVRAALDTLRSIDLKTDADSAAEFVEVIDRHSRRMQALVSDLLDLSRIESPATAFKPAAVDVGHLVAELHAAFAVPLERKSLHWEVTIEEGCEHCTANPELLRMALRNLVDNAIQFMEPGGHVRVDAHAEPGAWLVSVADDGCGIPEAEQHRIFERFYQVQRARTGPKRGTGLGLSIVRHAVTAMGGTVSLASRLGAGTKVTIAVPQPAS